MAGHYTPTPGGTQTLTQNQAIQQAAIKWNIPQWLLYGVWGQETAFGKNVKTSSGGAIGDFQFLPSTAGQYGYPLTNTPDAGQFAQQADSAAHYLSDLFKSHGGDWNAALEAYSGHWYGLPQIQQQWKNAPGGFNPGNSPLNPPSISIPNPLAPIQGVAAIAGFLTNPTNWLRIGEVIAGMILIAMGLRSLTGSTTSPADAVKTGAKLAATKGLA